MQIPGKTTLANVLEEFPPTTFILHAYYTQINALCQPAQDKSVLADTLRQASHKLPGLSAHQLYKTHRLAGQTINPHLIIDLSFGQIILLVGTTCRLKRRLQNRIILIIHDCTPIY